MIDHTSYFADSLLIATTSRTTTRMPATVQTHIPPPTHPPIHPPVWLIIKPIFVALRPASLLIHTLHPLHHRALRHGFLAHLHMLHHVLHHRLVHLCRSRIHGNPLLHHLGDEGGHHAHLRVLRRAVHPGDMLGEFSVLSLHVFLHFLFLVLHFLAVFHHLGIRHAFPLRRLGGLR